MIPQSYLAPAHFHSPFPFNPAPSYPFSPPASPCVSLPLPSPSLVSWMFPHFFLSLIPLSSYFQSPVCWCSLSLCNFSLSLCNFFALSITFFSLSLHLLFSPLPPVISSHTIYLFHPAHIQNTYSIPPFVILSSVMSGAVVCAYTGTDITVIFRKITGWAPRAF